jgi:hypothetical protein
MGRHRHRRARSRAVPAVALILGIGTIISGSVGSASAATPSIHYGLLGTTGQYYSYETAAGVNTITIGVLWAEAEPANGTFSASYLASINQQITTAVAAGMLVVIEPGMQYAPSWVFSLPGGTRFVDQYGDAFTGSAGSGDDVANGVTDLSVRSAMGVYLAHLGSSLTMSDVLAVRQGGGPLGELRYPDAEYNGQIDCYWAYDASSQATSSALAYVPGTGTAVQATAFLNQYNADLNSFADWMNAQYETDFHKTTLVLLPGWGQRPGVAAEEEADLLEIPYDEFNQGLDWADLLPSLPDRADTVAYTTYLDATSQGPAVQNEAPAMYIASLASPLGMRLGGENTGNGTVQDLVTTVEMAKSLGFWMVNWLGESQVVASTEGLDPAGPTISQIGQGAQYLNG